MAARLMDRDHFELGLGPVADFAGADPTYTDVINMKNHGTARAIVAWGVGATGTVKFTINACDDVVPTTEVAIPFSYRVTAAGGTPGTPTRVAAADGFTNTAGSDQIVELEFNAEDLSASGYSYFRVKFDEVVNSPILAGCVIQLAHPRHATGATTATV